MKMTELKHDQPPPPQRRPRVREVSSRFMSPVSSPAPSPSSSTSSLSPRADENRPTRAVLKLFKDHSRTDPSRSVSVSRPATPVVSTSSKSRHHHHHHHRSVSDAEKLLLSQLPTPHQSSSDIKTSTYSLRSSMPEPNISAGRLLAERNLNTAAPPPPPPPHPSKVCRSVNLQRSASQDPEIFRSQTHSLNKMPCPAASPFPFPSPSPVFGEANSRKPMTKINSHQQDINSLRLLHNHYLQWRFVNAKAQTSVQAQSRETQKSIYSHAIKLADLYESVRRKRIELALLHKTKALTTIIDAQMPYLEEWSSFEADYSVSFSEATQALLNTSIKVPMSGNVRADTREVGEALNSALKLMETIALQIQGLMPQAEETESLVSELTRMGGLERGLIQECGDLLCITHKSQVEECSLRGQLIQLHRSCEGQAECSNNTIAA